MNEEPATPHVLDNTVVSNFSVVESEDVDLSDSLVDRPVDLLARIKNPVVPAKVVEETEQGLEAGYDFFADGLEAVEEHATVERVDPPDGDVLGSGERHALVLARREGGTVATDGRVVAAARRA
jgi:hypothetical protein